MQRNHLNFNFVGWRPIQPTPLSDDFHYPDSNSESPVISRIFSAVRCSPIKAKSKKGRGRKKTRSNRKQKSRSSSRESAIAEPTAILPDDGSNNDGESLIRSLQIRGSASGEKQKKLKAKKIPMKSSINVDTKMREEESNVRDWWETDGSLSDDTDDDDLPVLTYQMLDGINDEKRLRNADRRLQIPTKRKVQESSIYNYVGDKDIRGNLSVSKIAQNGRESSSTVGKRPRFPSDNDVSFPDDQPESQSLNSTSSTSYEYSTAKNKSTLHLPKFSPIDSFHTPYKLEQTDTAISDSASKEGSNIADVLSDNFTSPIEVGVQSGNGSPSSLHNKKLKRPKVITKKHIKGVLPSSYLLVHDRVEASKSAKQSRQRMSSSTNHVRKVQQGKHAGRVEEFLKRLGETDADDTEEEMPSVNETNLSASDLNVVDLTADDEGRDITPSGMKLRDDDPIDRMKSKKRNDNQKKSNSPTALSRERRKLPKKFQIGKKSLKYQNRIGRYFAKYIDDAAGNNANDGRDHRHLFNDSEAIEDNHTSQSSCSDSDLRNKNDMLSRDNCHILQASRTQNSVLLRIAARSLIQSIRNKEKIDLYGDVNRKHISIAQLPSEGNWEKNSHKQTLERMKRASKSNQAGRNLERYLKPRERRSSRSGKYLKSRNQTNDKAISQRVRSNNRPNRPRDGSKQSTQQGAYGRSLENSTKSPRPMTKNYTAKQRNLDRALIKIKTRQPRAIIRSEPVQKKKAIEARGKPSDVFKRLFADIASDETKNDDQRVSPEGIIDLTCDDPEGQATAISSRRTARAKQAPTRRNNLATTEREWYEPNLRTDDNEDDEYECRYDEFGMGEVDADKSPAHNQGLTESDYVAVQKPRQRQHQQSITDFLTAESSSSRTIDKLSNYFPLHFSVAPLAAGTQCAASFISRMSLMASYSGQCLFSLDTSSSVRATSNSPRVEARWEVFQASISLKDHETVLSLLPSWFDEIGVSVLESFSSNCRFSKSKQLLERCLEEVIQFGAFISAYIVSLSAHSPFGGQQNVEQVNSHRSSNSVFAFVKRLYESMQEWINQFGDYDKFYHFCASTSPRMRLRKFAAFQIYTKLLSYFLEWAYLISSNIVIEDTELPSDDISRANTVTLLDSFSFPVFSKQLFRQMIILSLGEPDLGDIFHGMDKMEAEYTTREWNLDPLNELWVLAVKLIDLFAYRAALQSYSDDFGRPGNSWDILKETVDYIMNDSEFQLTGLPTVMVPPLKITSFKYAWLSESIWKVVFDMLRISQFDASLAISSQPSHSLQIGVNIHKVSDEWDLIDRLLRNSVVSGSLNEDELQKWIIQHKPESRRRIGRDLRDNGIRAILERYHSLIFHWDWQPHVGTVLLIASWFQKRMFENLDLEGIRWNKRLHDEILFPRYWRDLVMSTNTSAPIVTELAISADDSAMSIFLKIVHLNLSVPDSTEHHRRSRRKLEMKILPTNSVTLPRPSSTVPASCNHTLTTLINRYSLLLLCIRIFSVHDADRYSKFNRMMTNLCNFPESIDEARMISITSWMIHAKMNLIGGLSLQPVIQALSGYIKIISDEWNRTINEGNSLIFNADKNEEKMNVLVMIFSNLERLLKWQNRLKPFLLCDEHFLLSGDFLEIIRLEKCPPNALLGAVISFCSTFISELSKSKSSMTLASQVGISHCPDVDIGDSQFSDHFDWDDLMDVNINTDNPNEELAVENLKSVLIPLLSDIISAKLGTTLRLNYPVPKASKLPKINDEVARSALECIAELAVLFREKDHTLETNLITQYSQLPFIMGQIHQKHELCVYFTYKLLQLDPTYYEQYQGQINELVFTALIKPRCAPSWDLVKLVLKHPKHSEFFRNLATSSRHSDLNDSTKRTRLKLLRGIFKNMGKIFFETRARSVSESSILKRQYEDIIIKLCDRMRGFVEDSTEHHSNDSSKYAQFCFDVVELLFEHCSNIIYDSSSSTVLWGPVHPNITYFSSKSLIGFAHLTHQLRSIGTTSFWVEDIRTRDSVINLFRAEFEDITIEELNAMHKQSRPIAFAEALRNSALTAITVDEWSSDLSNFRLFIVKTFVMSYYNSFLREPVQNNTFWLLASVTTQFLQVLYCFIQQDILKLKKCHQPAAILAVCSEIYWIIKVVAQVVLSISDSISPSIAILAKSTFSLIATLTSLVSSLSLLMPSDPRLDSFQNHYTQFLSCIIHQSHSYYLSHHRTIRKSEFLDKHLIQFEHAGLSFQSAELELCQNDIPSCNINPQRQRPPVVDINKLNRDEWLDDTVTSIFNLWTEIVNYDSKFLPWLLETLPLLYEFYSSPQRLSRQVNLFNTHLVVPLGLSGQNYLIEARHLKRSKRTRRFSVDAIVL